jgi:hypothetical protein
MSRGETRNINETLKSFTQKASERKRFEAFAFRPGHR